MKNKVFLIGAGPGDPGLITLKAIEKIKEADVIIYDRLMNKKILNYSSEKCELVYAGKKPNNHYLNQNEINSLLASKFKEGKKVVRLKGGDPFVFGRGGEEGVFLEDKKIPFEIIPGITSAIASLTYAGIPITYRDVANSFHVVTGHFKKESEKNLNFNALAKLNGTLVFLMGIGNIEKITNGLIKENMHRKTAAAVIQWGTYGKQKSIVATLDTISRRVKEEKITPPGIIVIGNVIKFKNKLNFFEKLPLFNKKVGITRPTTRNKELVNKVISMGGEAIELPSIEINKINQSKLENAIRKINKYNWLVFTSVNAVEIFFEKIFEIGLDLRILGDIKFAVVGKSTKNKLKEYGINVDLIPEKYTGKNLAKKLVKIVKSDEEILIPRSLHGKKEIVKILEKKCNINDLSIYELKKPKVDKKLLDISLDYVLFTSPSTFINFYSRVSKKYFENVKIISIGPVTSSAIKEKKLNVYKEVENHTIEGLIDYLEGDKNEID